MSPVGRMPVPPKCGQKSRNLDTLNPCLTPSSSWGMGPGESRPSHPSAEGQMAPASGLMNRRANHLLQSLVALPQPCGGPSGCNEAAGLGLLWEGMQWGLVCPETGGPPGFQGWAPIGLPSLGGWGSSSGGGSLVGSVGTHFSLQYSFLIKVASLSWYTACPQPSPHLDNCVL